MGTLFVVTITLMRELCYSICDTVGVKYFANIFAVPEIFTMCNFGGFSSMSCLMHQKPISHISVISCFNV